MASAQIRKQCGKGDGCKQPAAANCEGCSKAFCIKHLLDHRRLLGEEMNVIISEHDQFQYTLNQQITNPNSHPIIEQIDEWEKDSIDKIQQRAKALRQELFQVVTAHSEELSKKLRNLKEELNENQNNDAYIETDLHKWKATLNDLKVNLASPSTFNISQSERQPLVQNIFLGLIDTRELFDRVFNNAVRIGEDGQVAIRDASQDFTEIRGKNEYTSGAHEIRLRIEQSTHDWAFIGINSKSTPLQERSYTSKSSYGWSNNNNIWLNGQYHQNKSTSRIEMKTNDIISLILDCDKRKILMINQRTNAKYKFNVNIDYCPFPWQLHVILYEPNSRVRILSA